MKWLILSITSFSQSATLEMIKSIGTFIAGMVSITLIIDLAFLYLFEGNPTGLVSRAKLDGPGAETTWLMPWLLLLSWSIIVLRYLVRKL